MDHQTRDKTQRSFTTRVALALALSTGLTMIGCEDEGDSPGDVVDAGDGDQGDGDDVDAGDGDGDDVDAGDGDGDDVDAGDGDEADAGDGGDVVVTPKTFEEKVVAKTAALSADRNDRFWSAAFGDDGKLYAAGFTTLQVSETVNDQVFAVARFTVDGNLDTTFGDDGVATVNVGAATTASDTVEMARGVAIQSDGKVLVGGTAWVSSFEAEVAGSTVSVQEHSLVVARFTKDGVLDATGPDAFGTAGVATVDLGVALPPATAAGSATNESLWGLAVDSSDRAVLFAAGRSEAAERTDTDRFVVRLTTAGALDTTFAGDGKFSFDARGGLNDSARSGQVLSDGRILSTGYTNIPVSVADATITRNHIVLAVLKADGTPDATFGEDGIVISNILAQEDPNAAQSGMVEAYSGTEQSDGRIVTGGYGWLNNGDLNSIVSFRFGQDGAVDTDYGTSGLCIVDERPTLGEQARNIVALPDDRLVVVGQVSGQGALVVLLTKDGELDLSFNDVGHKEYTLSGVGDAFWGVAVSKDGKYVGAAGSSGGAANAADAAIAIFELK